MAVTKQEKCIQTEKTVLSNPELYHTPGYCGFCPQFKFQIGETFGRTTTRLLTDPNVPKSGRTLLADLKPAKSGYPPHGTPAGHPANKSRKSSFGDQKFTEQMVPGYTGYIPKSQHYYGNRYAEICREAVSQFERDQQREKKKMADMKTIQRIQAGELKAPEPPKGEKPLRTSPLRKLPGTKFECPNYSTMKEQHLLSPYYMTNDDPQKCFMSGYTGFVPNARGMTGMGYPILTNRALVAFTNDTCCPTGSGSTGCKAARDLVTAGKLCQHRDKIRYEVIKRICGGRQLPVIYPIESGLVPHYTGHIPGQKFRYGTTFGHSTKNAKREPTLKKKISNQSP